MDDKLLDTSMCPWTGKIGGRPTDWPTGLFASIASWLVIYTPILLGIAVGLLTSSWAWGTATPFLFLIALAGFVFFRWYWPTIEPIPRHPEVQKQLDDLQ